MITYEYDGRGLTTKQTDALGNVTEYEYDGNGNLVYKVDADAMVTEFTYNALDMVTHINYNGGKEVDYVYNAVGDLVRMEDWTGINTFEYDLLSQLKRVTDHKGNVVEYTYDGNGNQTSLTYPDDTTVEFTYDLVNNLSTVTESDGRTTSYEYDGMGRVVRMEYPHGWVEEYEYDSIGQLLRVTDIDPSQKDMKQQKHIYEYDTCGNMTYEYMRGNGTGEATVENTYTYDALHRITNVHEDYGNDNRSYTYDSLGNLTYETAQGNKSVDYILNNLNQVVESSDDGWKSQTAYTYDGRGNLVEKAYGKNKKVTTVGEYVYDETNRMVLGYNALRESSEYLYNGLGALVTNTWVIAKNGYGYHDVDSLVSEMSVLTGQELMDALEIYNEDTLAETVNLHYFGDEIAPNLDPSAPDDSDLLEEEPGTDLEQPDEEEPVVEPEQPDEEEPVVEPEQPDEEKPVVEPEQPDEEKPVVEPEQPDEEKPMVGPEQPDEEKPVVEPERPDEEKPVVEPEQPNKEEPAVEPDSPDMDASDTAESPVPEMTEEPDVQTPEPSEETPDAEKPESEVPPEETLPETKEPTLEEPEVSDPEEQVPDTPATAPDSNQGNGNSAGNNGQGNGNNASNGDGNGSLNKTSTVVKEFVVDYNTETFEPLMEHEVNGLDYKYVYGNDRLSVDITPIPQGANHIIENGDHVRLYYHMDYLGTADYLTSPVSLKVEAWTHYDERGRITHNAVLKCGQRELDLVKRYATHDYDSVLELYYAKARFYDANGRHFVAMDPILDPSQYDLSAYVQEPMLFMQYLYAVDNPLINVDINGLCYFDVNGNWQHDNWEYVGNGPLKSNPRNSVLTQGSRGENVSIMQSLLVEHGYLEWSDIDGSFGPKTLQAVYEFQEDSGLEVDGSVGPKTWAAFFDNSITNTTKTANTELIYMPEQLLISQPGNGPKIGIDITGINISISGADISNTFFEWDDKKKIWYSEPEAIQGYFGYNDVYDAIFSTGDFTGIAANSMFISIFDYKGYKYRVEGWKGNYLWMGVGAEIGIYYNRNTEIPDIEIPKAGVTDYEAAYYMTKLVCENQFLVAPEDIWRNMKMEFSLYYRDRIGQDYLIFRREEQSHWWLNGFRPEIGVIAPENLVMEGSITFLDNEMATAFKSSLDKPEIIKNKFSNTKTVEFDWVGR